LGSRVPVLGGCRSGWGYAVCGRFSVGRPTSDLAAEFEADDLAGEPALRTGTEPAAAYLAPDYNVAPGKLVAAVVSRRPVEPGSPRRRELRLLRWGLVPSWADRPDPGARLINARAQTAAGQPAFRGAPAARRRL